VIVIAVLLQLALGCSGYRVTLAQPPEEAQSRRCSSRLCFAAGTFLATGYLISGAVLCLIEMAQKNSAPLTWFMLLLHICGSCLGVFCGLAVCGMSTYPQISVNQISWAASRDAAPGGPQETGREGNRRHTRMDATVKLWNVETMEGARDELARVGAYLLPHSRTQSEFLPACLSVGSIHQ